MGIFSSKASRAHDQLLGRALSHCSQFELYNIYCDVQAYFVVVDCRELILYERSRLDGAVFLQHLEADPRCCQYETVIFYGDSKHHDFSGPTQFFQKISSLQCAASKKACVSQTYLCLEGGIESFEKVFPFLVDKRHYTMASAEDSSTCEAESKQHETNSEFHSGRCFYFYLLLVIIK